MTQLIAVDLGFGYTKAIADSEEHIVQFPSVIGLAEQITMQQHLTDGTHLSGIHLKMPDGDRFVGQMAIDQSSVNWSARDKKRTDHDTLTLLYAALSELDLQSGKYRLVTGLPVRWYNSQRDHLVELLSGPHTIRRQGRPDLQLEIVITPEDITLQPFGSLAFVAFNDKGHIQNGATVLRGQVGIIDIGMYTTDFIVTKNGQYIQPGSGHITTAMSRVYEQVQRAVEAEFDHTLSLTAIDRAIRTGRVTIRGQRHSIAHLVEPVLQAVVSHILAETGSKWDKLDGDLDTIFICGGGAPIVGPDLRDRFIQAAILPEEISSVTNVIGYRRYGLFMARRRPTTQATAKQNGKVAA